MRDIEPRDSREFPHSPNGRRKPALPNGSVVVRRNADELMDAVATDLFLHACACVREFGDFQLALGVWPDAEPLFLRLLYDPRFRELPWRRTHLWIVEERLDAPQPNFELLRETIVAQSDIPEEQVHQPNANEDYEEQFKGVLGWREKGQDRPDYILLPLLPGGLTQGSPASGTGAPLIDSAAGEIRMTRRLIEATRFISYLALGTEMKAAIRAVPMAPMTAGKLLARDVRPIGGELRWYVEEDNCEVQPGPPPIPLE
ncbi:MAG: 6-phosphogluconolactonase [Phycisphaeraceae bacterium]|nr:6-phosphogluconolactonase [Phycisphaeraceae bacterium]